MLTQQKEQLVTLCWEGLGFLEDTDLSQHLNQSALLINTLPGLHNKTLKPVLTRNKIKVSVKVIVWDPGL